MNYYEHHIGDYAEATAHLSFVEDAAYSRLIRKYYATEKPIPADLKAAQRLVGARTREEREAVRNVLEEFFEQKEDGFHHPRCDREISAYRASEPQREAKKRNEDTRMARHRAERAELFAIINDAGQHLPWNIGITELRAAAQRISSAGTPGTPPAATLPATGPATPATLPATGPVTLPAMVPATPATATHTRVPLPTSHLPLPNPLDTNTSEASPLHPTAAAPPSGRVNGHHPKPPEQPGLPAVPEPPEHAIPPCPHQQLIALYAKHLGHLRQPRGWEGARAEAMRTRWRECAKPSEFSRGYTTVEGGLAFWDRFFRYVATTDLAAGFPRENGKRWLPDLPWLVAKENFLKVIEGSYAQ